MNLFSGKTVSKQVFCMIRSSSVGKQNLLCYVMFIKSFRKIGMKMKRNSNLCNKIIYGILAVLCIGFFLVSILQYRPYAVNSIEARPQKIEFEGVYQTKDPIEQSLKNGQITTEDIENEVTLRGHFKQKIEEDTMLYFRIYHISVKMFQNGTEIYSYGDKNEHPAVYHSLGDLWDGLKLHQSISPEDTIEFKLTSPVGLQGYRIANNYNYFFDNIYAGNPGQMIRAVIIDNWPHLLLSLFLITNGIALWFGAMILKYAKININQIVFNGAYLFVVMGLWMLVGGQYLSVLTSYNGVIMSMDYMLLFLMSALIFRYMSMMIESRLKLIIHSLECTSLLLLLLYMLLQTAGIMDGYALQMTGVFILFTLDIVMIICLFIEYVRYKKTTLKYILSSIIFFIVFVLIGLSEFLLKGQQNDVWYDFGIFVFVLMQLVFIVNYIRQKFEEAEKAEAMRLELAEMKIQMMTSQIRPHFVFNTLNAISALCLEDPIKADEAIVKFSKYLRANIAVLEGAKLIRFEKEVEFIENYVSIEQMRFPERIAVKFDIKFKNFWVSMLSIQPIVENAIKHGIAKKKEGGTVVVKSIREENNAVVTIIDDGVGFDINKISVGQESVGMRNIRERLQISSKARVKVESTPGKGTCVTIYIPLENKKQENLK